MDSAQEGGIDSSGRTRKFGLPNWMVNNIERLNFATDFEQYGSSPPETEGFLSDYMENHDRMDTYSDSSHSTSEHSMHENSSPTVENMSSANLIRNAVSEQVSPHCHSLLTNLRHEDLYSSPDSTPCATPEPSPIIRRKLSIPQPHDTIQTNPGRWFYMGKFKKPDKPQSILANCNKENQSNTQQERDALKDQDKFAKPNRPTIQLVISNFDLNAVSPTSW